MSEKTPKFKGEASASSEARSVSPSSTLPKPASVPTDDIDATIQKEVDQVRQKIRDLTTPANATIYYKLREAHRVLKNMEAELISVSPSHPEDGKICEFDSTHPRYEFRVQCERNIKKQKAKIEKLTQELAIAIPRA